MARYDLVLVWPVYAALYLNADENAAHDSYKKIKQIAHFVLGLLPAIVAYIAWSYIRLGSSIDRIFWLWYQVDPYGYKVHPGGPFQLANVPWNLYTAFFMTPFFSHSFPWIRPWRMGTALTFTSPAFLLALRAPWCRLETWLLWTAVGLSMGAVLLVYANGFVQFGARYWIQSFPFLLMLMWRGRKLDQMGKVLIVVSILACDYGMWVIRMYGFAGPII